jgi:hypothetical protein
VLIAKFFPEPDVKTFIVNQQTQHYASLLAVTALLLSIGFLIGASTERHNYQALYSVMPSTGWAFCFFVYAACKFAQATKLFTPLFDIAASLSLGIWLWSAIFVSSVVLDPTAMAPMELVIVTPLLIESYQLALDISRYRAAKLLEDQHEQ